MTRLVLLVAIVVACHPDGGHAQHPAEAPPPAEAQQPVEAQHPAVPQATSSPSDARPPAGHGPLAQSGASDDSALAVKRWVYASFFNRIKRKVAQSWDPYAVLRRVDPEGTVYGTATRHTEVRVILSSSGEIVDIVVTAPSGVNELDDEAVRAFRAAAPFRDPPEGLALNDGRITFSFSFSFEADAKRMAWRLPAVK